MATQRLYRVTCDGCGRVVGNLVSESGQARRVANANGIRRVHVATFTLRGEAPGPYRRADRILRDLCATCLGDGTLDRLRAAATANRARHDYLPIG